MVILQLTHYSLAAATKHGLDTMLPVLVSYLPSAWQLITNIICSCQKLLQSCQACQAGGASNSSSSSSTHIGPAVVSVLRNALEEVGTAWQCYQALVEQRSEQRRLYMLSLDSQDAEAADLLLNPGGSQRSGSQGSAGAATAAAGAGGDRLLQAELQREMKWMVHLLQIGKQLCVDTSSDAAVGEQCSGCVSAAVTAERMLSVWKTAVECVFKATSASLPKVIISSDHIQPVTRAQVSMFIITSMPK